MPVSPFLAIDVTSSIFHTVQRHTCRTHRADTEQPRPFASLSMAVQKEEETSGFTSTETSKAY